MDERVCGNAGNTAVYMLYAYARICQIIRKAGVEPSALPTSWQSFVKSLIFFGVFCLDVSTGGVLALGNDGGDQVVKMVSVGLELLVNL